MKKIFLLIVLLTFLFSCNRKEETHASNIGNKVTRASQRGKSAKSEHQHSANCPCCSHFKENLSTNSTTESADDKKVEQNVNKFSNKLNLDSLTPEEQEEYIKNILETMTVQEAVRHSRIFRGRFTDLGIKFAKQLLAEVQTESEKAMAMGLLGIFLADKIRYTGENSLGEPKYEEAKNMLENALGLMKKQYPNHNELNYSMNSVLISLNLFYLQSESNIDKSLRITDEYFELIKNNNRKTQPEESINYLFDNIFQILKYKKNIKLNQKNFNRIYNFVNSIKADNIAYKDKKQSLEEFKKETLKILNQYKKEVYGK